MTRRRAPSGSSVADSPRPVASRTGSACSGSTGSRLPRPLWRQRLIQAERGLAGGLRRDSTFFAQFFGWSIVLPTGFVLGISTPSWILVLLCLTMVLTAELLIQSLRLLLTDPERERTAAEGHALALLSAASLVSTAGAAIVIAIVFWQRWLQLI